MKFLSLRLKAALHCLAIAVFALEGKAQSSVWQVEPFSGTALENWESFDRASVYARTDVPLSIFGGAATISGPNEFIWISQIGVAEPNTGGFGLGPYAARSHDGEQGYGTGLAFGTSSIVFETGVSQFGGYWGNAGADFRMTFTFFDEQGTEFASDSVVYSTPNNNGTLEWFGWESDVRIGRVDYSGAFVVNDSLRFTVVPEPAIGFLFIAGASVVLALRRKTSK